MLDYRWREYLTIHEAAAVCGYAPETMRMLIELEVGPISVARKSYRKIVTDRIRDFARCYPNPNKRLPKCIKKPLFARHDDGRWWPIITREEAQDRDLQRYFEGVPCEAGHVVKRYTKTGKCVDCSAVANGRLTTKQKRNNANNIASPGCNAP